MAAENREQQILELLEERRFVPLRKLLVEMEPADIASLMEDIPEEKLPVLYRLLPKELAADVFVEFESDAQELLIRAFSDKELREVLDELFVDDAVDMIEEMPATVVKRILKHTKPDMRKAINQILAYPKDSAGSIMTIEYVDLKRNMTVADAFNRIRKTGLDRETVYTCYVTDENRKLQGVITVKTMLLSRQDEIIGDIMETNIIYVSTTEDKEQVVQAFDKYDFLALPVVDKEDRLVGIITVDDAIDVMQEEATEDIEKMAAILPSEKPYFKIGVFETWKNRIPWLLLMMLSATFTGMIITGFEEKLAASIALTAFIPMLMGTGGNAGSQVAVTVIRSLSLGDIELRDALKVLWKEWRVSFVCGLTLAVANFAKMMLIDRMLMNNPLITIEVALTVCLTLFATVVLAKLVGCLLPIGSKAIGLDPAVMASPLITTIVDTLSLLAYFFIASSILNL